MKLGRLKLMKEKISVKKEQENKIKISQNTPSKNNS
jgi:hypothetical protein